MKVNIALSKLDRSIIDICYSALSITLMWLTLVSASPAPTLKSNRTDTEQGIEQSAPVKIQKNTQQPCLIEQRRRESELCAQWYAADAAHRSADWAMWSTIVGGLGFAGILYTLLLTRRSTNAAIQTLESQIAASRPMMNVRSIKITNHAEGMPAGTHLMLRAEWVISNFGASGCFLESVCTMLDHKIPDNPNLTELKATAFIAPEKGISTDESMVGFNQQEANDVIESKKIFFFGYIIYRDLSRQRWKTGFCVEINLRNDLSSQSFSPMSADKHWTDERLPG